MLFTELLLEAANFLFRRPLFKFLMSAFHCAIMSDKMRRPSAIPSPQTADVGCRYHKCLEFRLWSDNLFVTSIGADALGKSCLLASINIGAPFIWAELTRLNSSSFASSILSSFALSTTKIIASVCRTYAFQSGRICSFPLTSQILNLKSFDGRTVSTLNTGVGTILSFQSFHLLRYKIAVFPLLSSPSITTWNGLRNFILGRNRRTETTTVFPISLLVVRMKILQSIVKGHQGRSVAILMSLSRDVVCLNRQFLRNVAKFSQWYLKTENSSLPFASVHWYLPIFTGVNELTAICKFR